MLFLAIALVCVAALAHHAFQLQLAEQRAIREESRAKHVSLDDLGELGAQLAKHQAAIDELKAARIFGRQ